jgi:biopolymer transport protein ExbB/TolQ
MDSINVASLVVVLVTLVVVLVTLVCVVRALREVRRTASLAEERMTYLHEEQERLSFFREQHRGLEEKLERERQERSRVQEELERAHDQHLEVLQKVLQKAEGAEQEAANDASRSDLPVLGKSAVVPSPSNGSVLRPQLLTSQVIVGSCVLAFILLGLTRTRWSSRGQHWRSR